MTYSAIIEAVLKGDVSGDRPKEVTGAFRQVAGLIDRDPTEALIRVQADSATVDRFFVQVVDRRDREAVGPYCVRLWVTTDSVGLVPGGSQTVAFIVGTVLDTLAANERYRVLTDPKGRIELTVTDTVPQTVRLVLSVDGFMHVSDSILLAAASTSSGTWDFSTADNSDQAMLMW